MRNKLDKICGQFSHVASTHKACQSVILLLDSFCFFVNLVNNSYLSLLINFKYRLNTINHPTKHKISNYSVCYKINFLNLLSFFAHFTTEVCLQDRALFIYLFIYLLFISIIDNRESSHLILLCRKNLGWNHKNKI